MKQPQTATLFLILLFCQLFCSFCIAQPATKLKPVTITANLKGTSFDFIPVDRLINDFLDKQSIVFANSFYDSTSGDYKGTFFIDKPQLMLFFLKEVFVTPGDSVNLQYVVLKNTVSEYKDTLIVSGINENNYLYYTFFRDEYTSINNDFPKYQAPLDKLTFRKYDIGLLQYYNKLRVRILNSLKTGKFSKLYKTYALQNLIYYWCNNYLEAFNTLIPKTSMPNRKAQIKNYLLQMPDTTSHSYFEALRNLHYSSVFTNGLYTSGDFRSLERDALTYTGVAKDYLLTIDILDFIKNKRQSADGLKNALHRAFKKVKLEKYKRLVSTDKIDLIAENRIVPSKLKEIKFISINGDTLSFHGLLAKNLKKIVYVDFWASWCIPCRAETEALKGMYKKYSEKDISVLQISIDEKDDKWKKAIADDDVRFSQNYRICNVEDFKKFKYEFSFEGIPYYLLINNENNQGIITVQNAPRPSEVALMEKLFKQLDY